MALLLAIFRSRPSPFCVLDEVDAALDEANIERFIGVLQEFLTWTQFIVVTHSKKTMTCASTLYGVTMQESGVSKRVSVRFEDVSETGEFKTYQDIPDDAGRRTSGIAGRGDAVRCCNYIHQAHKHLRKADPVLRKVIDRADGFTLKLEAEPLSHAGPLDYLAANLDGRCAVRSEAGSRRWSRPAADGRERRRLDGEQLRSAGLSQQKAAYLHALAAAVAEKSLRLDRAARMDDEELIEHLTAVKGIGVWTAQMFLIFSLGRPDVFPHDDLGVRSAIQHLYGLKTLPDRATSSQHRRALAALCHGGQLVLLAESEHRKADA